VLKTRILVAIIFLPLFTWLIYLTDPIPLFIFAFCGLLVATLELGRMVRQRDIPFRWWITISATLALCLTAASSKHLSGIWPINAIALFWIIGILSLLLLGLQEVLSGFHETKSFAAIGASFLPIFAIGGIGTFVFLLRLMPEGSSWWIILFGFNWIYDAAALFSGKFFGRRALAPSISPAKTVEGLIGGLIINGLVAVAGYYVWLPETMGFSLAGFVILGILMGILSQAGDLVESMVKRWSGIKDASGIIPGHGGILDKIDNLCFTAPVLFAVAWWLMNS